MQPEPDKLDVRDHKGYDEQGIAFKKVIILGGLCLVIMCLSILFLPAMFSKEKVTMGSHLKSMLHNPFHLDSGFEEMPLLQVTNGPEDLKKLHESENAILLNYGWSDKAKGIVHIPIEEAMNRWYERYAGKGSPPAPSGVRP